TSYSSLFSCILNTPYISTEPLFHSTPTSSRHAPPIMHPSRQAFVEDEPPPEPAPGLTLAEIPTERDYNLGGNLQTSAVFEQFQRKRLAAQVVVPTDDKRVRLRLRELGEPITLFGEGPVDRR